MSTAQEPAEVSNCLTHSTPPKPRTGALADKLRLKGWSMSSAALYLGVSRQRLYTVFADPGRARLWDCAIEGMPACTPEISQSLQALRARRPKAAPRPVVHVEEFEPGDVVMCTKHAGIAQEDDEGHIAGLRGSDASLEILVVMPDGQDWFPRALFYDHFATTGLNIHR